MSERGKGGKGKGKGARRGDINFKNGRKLLLLALNFKLKIKTNLISNTIKQ